MWKNEKIKKKKKKMHQICERCTKNMFIYELIKNYAKENFGYIEQINGKCEFFVNSMLFRTEMRSFDKFRMT